MFEQPLWFLLLLLALPWVRWARARAPRPWPVGGLAPFQGRAAPGGGRRRWPLSLYLGLLALMLATTAVAGPRTIERRTLRIFDASLSTRAVGWPNRWTLGENMAEAVVVGRDGIAAEPELFEAIRLHDQGGPIQVLTDRPAPRGMPGRVLWLADEREKQNAAILNAWQDESGNWWIHWENWGVKGEIVLETPAGIRPLLAPGIVRLGSLPPGELRLRTTLPGRLDARENDDSWPLPRPVKMVFVPADAHEDWRFAVPALWPGATVVQSFPADLAFSIGAPIHSPVPLIELEEDPFAILPEAEALARIAAAARAWLPGPGPRPRSECEPPGERVDWPAGLLADGGGTARGLGRALAGLGGLFYLAFLLARRLGR